MEKARIVTVGGGAAMIATEVEAKSARNDPIDVLEKTDHAFTCDTMVRFLPDRETHEN